MSVLIKDVKMPTCCEECAFVKTVGLDRWKCELSGVQFNAWDVGWADGTVNKYIRHESCPLVEVQTPHGRLIDVDAFSEEMKKRHKAASDWYDSVEDNEMLARAESTMMAFTECRLTLDAMQTIIEAEEET